MAKTKTFTPSFTPIEGDLGYHENAALEDDFLGDAMLEGTQNSLTFTLAGSASSEWFTSEGCDAIIVIATGAAKFYTCNEDRTVERELTFGGQVQTATSTKCGIMAGAVMPRIFKMKDTSTSSNTLCVHFIRRSRQNMNPPDDMLIG